MCAPCPQSRRARYHPIAAFEAFGARASGEDLETGFVARDGNGVGGSEGGGEGGGGGVGALYLVDVGGVERRGEGAEGKEIGVWGGDGVCVEAVGRDLVCVMGMGGGEGIVL